MAMEVTTDFYVRLGIDRTLDEEGIRKHLNKLKSRTTRRLSNPPKDSEAELNETARLCDKAIETLCNKELRQQYDEALQKAYKSGKLDSRQEKAFADILEQALEFYNDNKYTEAIDLAQKLVDGQTNDVRAYDLLARCYAETGKYAPAVDVLNKATGIFGDTPDLCQLGARVLSNAGEFDMAQLWVNRLMQVAGGSSPAHAEQIYLHLMKSDENLAFQEIDHYISEHPEDGVFKQQMAYALVGHQYAYYKEDASNDTIYLDTQEGYEKCVAVCEKAVSLYQDDYTTRSLEDARSFGEKSWNSWNVGPIKYTSIIGIVLFISLILSIRDNGLEDIILLPIALFFLATAGTLIYFSFRPRWQILRTYYTGEYGDAERIVHSIGTVIYKALRAWINWSIRFTVWAFKMLVGLIAHG